MEKQLTPRKAGQGTLQKSTAPTTLDEYKQQYPVVKGSLAEIQKAEKLAPTLAVMSSLYGNALTIHLVALVERELNSFLSEKKALSAQAEEAFVQVVIDEFGDMKQSELVRFLHNVRSGKYEKLYGDLDLISLCAMLRQFNEERSHAFQDVAHRHGQSVWKKEPEDADIYRMYEKAKEQVKIDQRKKELTKQWEQLRQQQSNQFFREYTQGYYRFIEGKDLEEAKKEWEDRHGNAPAYVGKWLGEWAKENPLDEYLEKHLK